VFGTADYAERFVWRQFQDRWRRVEANFLDHKSSLEIAGRIARYATSDRCHAQRGAEALNLAR
jgi:hypothetical protein